MMKVRMILGAVAPEVLSEHPPLRGAIVLITDGDSMTRETRPA